MASLCHRNTSQPVFANIRNLTKMSDANSYTTVSIDAWIYANTIKCGQPLHGLDDYESNLLTTYGECPICKEVMTCGDDVFKFPCQCATNSFHAHCMKRYRLAVCKRFVGNNNEGGGTQTHCPSCPCCRSIQKGIILTMPIDESIRMDAECISAMHISPWLQWIENHAVARKAKEY